MNYYKRNKRYIQSRDRCPNCRGTGKVKDATCDGDGYIYPVGAPSYPCPACNATGKLECIKCDGTGYV